MKRVTIWLATSSQWDPVASWDEEETMSAEDHLYTWVHNQPAEDVAGNTYHCHITDDHLLFDSACAEVA